MFTPSFSFTVLNGECTQMAEHLWSAAHSYVPDLSHVSARIEGSFSDAYSALMVSFHLKSGYTRLHPLSGHTKFNCECFWNYVTSPDFMNDLKGYYDGMNTKGVVGWLEVPDPVEQTKAQPTSGTPLLQSLLPALGGLKNFKIAKMTEYQDTFILDTASKMFGAGKMEFKAHVKDIYAPEKAIEEKKVGFMPVFDGLEDTPDQKFLDMIDETVESLKSTAGVPKQYLQGPNYNYQLQATQQKPPPKVDPIGSLSVESVMKQLAPLAALHSAGMVSTQTLMEDLGYEAGPKTDKELFEEDLESLDNASLKGIVDAKINTVLKTFYGKPASPDVFQKVKLAIRDLTGSPDVKVSIDDGGAVSVSYGALDRAKLIERLKSNMYSKVSGYESDDALVKKIKNSFKSQFGEFEKLCVICGQTAGYCPHTSGTEPVTENPYAKAYGISTPNVPIPNKKQLEESKMNYQSMKAVSQVEQAMRVGAMSKDVGERLLRDLLTKSAPAVEEKPNEPVSVIPGYKRVLDE